MKGKKKAMKPKAKKKAPAKAKKKKGGLAAYYK